MSKQPESAATMTIPNEGIGNLGGVMSATRTSSLDQLIGDAATPLFFNLVELVAACSGPAAPRHMSQKESSVDESFAS